MKRIVAALFATSFLAASAFAGEISGLSGLYNQNKVKNGLETTEMNLGLRYGTDPAGTTSYFGQLNYESTTFGGTNKPKEKPNTMAVSGGMYYWIPQISDRFMPYVTVALGYSASKDQLDNVAAPTTVSESSGVFYGSDVGIRFKGDEKWFIDFETNLFTSYLTRTTKTKPVGGGATISETTDTQLLFDSEGMIRDMKVGLGMVL